jgi:hypothetical protein
MDLGQLGTQPEYLVENLKKCESAPALNSLDYFTANREIGSVMKLYTDPAFFFDKWLEKEMQQREKARTDRRNRRKLQKDVPQPD